LKFSFGQSFSFKLFSLNVFSKFSIPYYFTTRPNLSKVQGTKSIKVVFLTIVPFSNLT